MALRNYLFVLPALVTLSHVCEVQAASLYATKCHSLTTSSPIVQDPALEVIDVDVALRTDLVPDDPRERREHVMISQALADDLGITDDDITLAGESLQIRVSLGSGSPVPSAVMTIDAIDAAEDQDLRLWIWPPADLENGAFEDEHNSFYKLYGAQNPDLVFAAPQTARVHSIATGSTMVVENGVVKQHLHFAEPNANSNKHFRDCVEVRAGRRLAVLVPHGGGIETKIDDELDTLLGDMSKYGQTPSVWTASGQWGGNTFARWHITATQIAEESFPGLARLLGGGTFDHAVALHGFEHPEKAVVIGGRANRRVKCYLVNTIENALDYPGHDGKITYKLFSPDAATLDILRDSTGPTDHPQPLTNVNHLDGLGPSNIVNRVAPNLLNVRNFGGIQIEMSDALRDDAVLFNKFMYALAIAVDSLVDMNPISDFCNYYT